MEMEIQRSFKDLDAETAFSDDQPLILAQRGWKGTFGWDLLLGSQRILIISEAGAGKTYECQTQQKQLFSAGESAFFFNLTELASEEPRSLLSADDEERFDRWINSQSEIGTFFLDSIDELQLTIGSFGAALRRLNKVIRNHLGRTRIVITSRPVRIDIQLIEQYLPIPKKNEFIPAPNGEDFANIAMGIKPESKTPKSEYSTPEWRTVALLPLSDEQIAQLATIQGVKDSAELLQQIRKRNAEDFARRPQDLIELCTDWIDHRSIRNHADQIKYNIEVKLRPNPSRRESSELTPERALEGASRLALAALLTRKLTIRHTQEADAGVDQGAALNPANILNDWRPDERKALLERALFGFASYGRVRFHHRSVLEYLAALRLDHLAVKGMSLRALNRLLFSETTEGVKVVKPSMRSVAAWLAASNDSIFDELITREPEVLINSADPEALPIPMRKAVLRTYVERYGSGGWRGLNIPDIQVFRLSTDELSPEVKKLWKNGIENSEVRDMLMELVASAPMHSCCDLAYSIVMNKDSSLGERIHALETLIEVNDQRVSAIVLSMEENNGRWSEDHFKPAILRLFPDHISIASLSRILPQLTPPSRSVGDLSWYLSRSIPKTKFEPGYLDDFRSLLTTIVMSGSKWDSECAQTVTSHTHLLAPLAASCVKLIQDGCITDHIIQSSVVALRLFNNHHHRDDAIEQLKETLKTIHPGLREKVFWADDHLCQEFHPTDNCRARLIEVSHRGALRLSATEDFQWIKASVSNPSTPIDHRRLLLEAAISLTYAHQGDRDNYLRELKGLVVDDPALVSQVEKCLQPQVEAPEIARMEAEIAEHKEKSERSRAKNHASWVTFWRKVAEHPDDAFSPSKQEATAYNLWQAMSRAGEDSRASGWNRRFIELHFGKEVADRMRLTLMTMWRNDHPTLRSERPPAERNTFLVKWQLGLAAIGAEAEDSTWAGRLSLAEASLALRYVPLELNGFPFWIDGVAKSHPDAIKSILGTELTHELDELCTHQSYSSTLNNLSNASSSITQILLPVLKDWLITNSGRLRTGEEPKYVADRLTDSCMLILTRGKDADIEDLRKLARNQLSGGLDSPIAKAWMSILMQLEPASATDLLEQYLYGKQASQYGPGVEWIATLFGERHSNLQVNLRSPGFTPEVLRRLVTLAYNFICTSDDLHHDDVYTPDVRDAAEHGRNALLSALFNTKGSEGWAAKLSVAASPLFAHLRDRVMYLARESLAEESDNTILSEIDFQVLDTFKEAPPISNNDMFALLEDRLIDIDDMLLRDDSPRELWALIGEERIMRREIARHLRSSANNLYTVDQESVTADEKETDIRLRSNGSPKEAAIELKLGDNRPGRDLRDTIRNQLVLKYMAPESCRSGCLLVTVSKDKKWEHPDTGELLDIGGLRKLLQNEATNVMQELQHEIRITTRVIDLRPRLPTEAEYEKKGKGKK